jgi:hypothetical protein
MNMRSYIYVHIDMYICIYIHICIYTYTYIYIFTHIMGYDVEYILIIAPIIVNLPAVD